MLDRPIEAPVQGEGSVRLVDVVERNNVAVSGVPGGQPIVFAHGFGCDQHMWTAVASAFIDRYRVVLFDHVGAGASDLQAYNSAKYSSLAGYAGDVVEIVQALDLTDVILVGHSVSAMIAALAVIEVPERFSRLVMVGPSARYLNDEGYVGGFEPEDIDGLLQTLESNYLGWSAQIAPAIVGNPDRPELGAQLTSSFVARIPVSRTSSHARLSRQTTAPTWPRSTSRR